MVSIRRENKNPQMAACHNVLVFPLYCRYIPKGTNQIIFPKKQIRKGKPVSVPNQVNISVK